MSRIVRIVATADEAVLMLKPDPELRFVMGRFSPARYMPEHYAYALPADQRTAFETFARVHGLTLVDASDASSGRVHPPPFRRNAAESEAERLERAAAYRRGAALARIRLNQARLVAARERVARRNAQP